MHPIGPPHSGLRNPILTKVAAFYWPARVNSPISSCTERVPAEIEGFGESSPPILEGRARDP
eukprot:7977743-Pyramimonas_sp.AAC.1